MNFVNAIKSGFKNYFRFKGTASRSEYWYWQGFNFLLYCVCLVIAQLSLTALTIASGILFFGLLIPNFLIDIRRLHDIGRSGHWMWLRYSAYYPVTLILIFSLIFYIVFTDWSVVSQTLKNSAAGGIQGGLTGDYNGSSLDSFKFFGLMLVRLFTSNFWLGKILSLVVLLNLLWGVAVWFWFAYLFTKPSLNPVGKNKNQPAVVRNPVLNRPGVRPVVDSVHSVLWRFSDFQGRASRSEFWYWLLACLVLIGVSGLTKLQLMTAEVLGMMMFGTATVAIRRLHDSGRSGHWLWLAGAIYPLSLAYLLWAFKIIEDNWPVLVYKFNALALAENEPANFNTALLDLKESWLSLDTGLFTQFLATSILAYLLALTALAVLLSMPSKGASRKKI